jgi:hypothetical protein
MAHSERPVGTGFQQREGRAMPLMPTANAAVANGDRQSVTFLMKNGAKPISILVSKSALETVETPSHDTDGYFVRFKLYRKSFEKIASRKYDMGHVELDGSICIRAMDTPLARSN